VCVDVVVFDCGELYSVPSPLDVAPTSPFISSKERARVTFVAKR
jgi:hypothetical protein